jgi:hypothetical protein
MTTSSIRTIPIIVATFVAGVAIGYFASSIPPEGDGMTGTVAPAERYRAAQPTGDDIVLGDQALQEFMQTDAFGQIMGNEALRDALSNAAVRDALSNASVRDALSNAAVRDALSNAAVRGAFSNAAVRDALSNAALRDAMS